MSYEIVVLLVTAVLGFVAVLIFRPSSYWVRMAVGVGVGFAMWLVKVMTIWCSYRV